MFDFKGKKVLVAGGTGLIGIPLVELLLARGAEVHIASLDSVDRAHPQASFDRIDLLDFSNCLKVCRDMDYVFNLLCVKGSPAAVKNYPATFFDLNLLLDINLLRAARACGVGGYLMASSLAVYAPAEIFYEDDVWKTMPSRNDWYAGWAKRMGEVQAEAYRLEHKWENISIVRPANTYGPWDNFDLKNAMVIPSLIRRVVDGENPLRVWGDGTPVRDFAYSRDVARGMLLVAESGITAPVNLGSGIGFSIKELVETILDCADTRPEVIWDTSWEAQGDVRRILDTARARSIGFEPEVSLKDGIKETLGWYKVNRDKDSTRPNFFG